MYNNEIKISSFYKVGIYIRLSKEDEDKERRRESESESIINQRNLLLSYVNENGYILIDEYVDDGYSGTTFDRPGFNRLISDIETGKINMVITKDLSRLGRDYIKSGYYVEDYFPSNKVRYVSILDNVDTFIDSTNNEIAPFKALFNDMVSKDMSKKIRSILKNKKEQGLFLGSSASFGYLRDPDDKHKLIIDLETAPIVKRIFNLALEGKSNSDISVILNNEKVITPLAYKKRSPTNRQKDNIYTWTNSSVFNILKNRIYTGDLVQNVQMKMSYKSKKRIILSPSNWIIKENNHKAIIDKKIFEIVNTKTSRRQRTLEPRDKFLLEGLVFCKTCGCLMGVSREHNRETWALNCNKYKRNPKLHLCTSRHIRYDKLEIAILNKINNLVNNKIDKDKLKDNLETNYKPEDNTNNIKDVKKILNNKLIELNNKRKSLYDDKFNNIITTDIYINLSKEVESEIEKTENQLLELEELISTKKEDKIYFKSVVDNFLKTGPTRDFLFLLIDNILVDENKNIEINYKISES